jgi:hypothetical protein
MTESPIEAYERALDSLKTAEEMNDWLWDEIVKIHAKGEWRDCAGRWEGIVPTRWVSPSADGKGDGSRERPWTMQQAEQNAIAGDIVLVTSHNTPDAP